MVQKSYQIYVIRAHILAPITILTFDIFLTCLVLGIYGISIFQPIILRFGFITPVTFILISTFALHV